MEVTAVYVEQVIIGLFVIVTVSFLLCGGLPAVPDGVEGGAALVALIAAAYVVGILYDRMADSMLMTVAAFGKIAYAVRGKKPFLTSTYIGSDPIREYELRLLMTPPSQLYVLSRMRILRAMTSLLPAMTVARCISGTNDPRFLVYVAAGYALYAALAQYWPVPQTRDVVAVNGFLRRRVRFDERGRMSLPLWRLLLYPPVSFVLLVAVAASVLFRDERGFILLGTMLTFLTGWAWLRVTDTHIRLVRLAVKHQVTA